jgi:hypothetical protein
MYSELQRSLCHHRQTTSMVAGRCLPKGHAAFVSTGFGFSVLVTAAESSSRNYDHGAICPGRT